MPNNRRKFIKTLGVAGLLPVVQGFDRLPAASMPARNNNRHRILSCNIRVALEEDEAKGHGWPDRKDICLKIIKEKKPDIVSFQEVLKVQADDIRNYFNGYQLFGFEGPEMDPHPTGYFGIAKNPILFDAGRYELLTGGTYWLSETPLVAGSKSWNTARARHANWIRLKEKSTGHEFRVVNFHLDHISDEARIQQAAMVVNESAQYQPGFTQVWSGDFNARYDSRVIDPLRNAGWLESYETLYGKKEAGYTTHEFQGTTYDKGSSKGRIDFIWYRGNLKPVDAQIIKDSIGGKFPSDHFFMQADFETD